MTTESQDISFGDAFDIAAAAYDDSGYTADEPAPQVEEPVIDAGASLQDDGEQTQGVEESPAGEGDQSQAPAPATDDVDYQALLAQRQAHVQLLESRLHTLSGQYQELKSQTQQNAPADDLSNGKADEADELPESFNEFMELYPEMAKPMQEYVERQVKSALNKVEGQMNKRVAPVETFMANSDRNAHLSAIKSVHPDFDNIAASPDLVNWIKALPPVARTGAIYVAERGNSDQVIALIDDFKKDKGLTKQQEKAPTPQAQAPDEDAIVKKVMAAMAVSSNRTRTTPEKNTPSSVPDDFDKAFDVYAREYEKKMRRR